jgi:hypothetical protein
MDGGERGLDVSFMAHQAKIESGATTEVSQAPEVVIYYTSQLKKWKREAVGVEIAKERLAAEKKAADEAARQRLKDFRANAAEARRKAVIDGYKQEYLRREDDRNAKEAAIRRHEAEEVAVADLAYRLDEDARLAEEMAKRKYTSSCSAVRLRLQIQRQDELSDGKCPLCRGKGFAGLAKRRCALCRGCGKCTNEQKALHDLYVSCKGRQWHNNTNWLEKPAVSYWYGVNRPHVPAGMPDDTPIERLCLQHNNLRGQLLGSICMLKNLVRLDLEGNMLTGSLPPSIGDMQALSVLQVDNNNLTGPIPFSIGKLKNLTTFRASRNRLSGEIPPSIGECLALKHVGLDTNCLTGSIPDSLSSLPELMNLYLHDNDLDQAVPEALDNMTTLANFTAYNNSSSQTHDASWIGQQFEDDHLGSLSLTKTSRVSDKLALSGGGSNSSSSSRLSRLSRLQDLAGS